MYMVLSAAMCTVEGWCVGTGGRTLPPPSLAVGIGRSECVRTQERRQMTAGRRNGFLLVRLDSAGHLTGVRTDTPNADFN